VAANGGGSENYSARAPQSEAATVLQQMTKSRPIAVRSQYCRNVVVVDRMSRRTVAVALLVAVQIFKMFKISHCDFPIAVHSIYLLSALAQLVLIVTLT